MNIYGVFHLPEHLPYIEKTVLKDVCEDDRIGLESEPETFEAYQHIDQSITPEEQIHALRETYLKRCRDNGVQGCDAWLTWEYWYRVKSVLETKTKHIIPIGSRKRTDFLTRLNTNKKTTEATLQYYMMMGPHFNAYLAKRSREENLSKLIVGIGHASVVAGILNARVHLQDMIDVRTSKLIASCEIEYKKKRVELPEL